VLLIFGSLRQEISWHRTPASLGTGLTYVPLCDNVTYILSYTKKKDMVIRRLRAVLI
jgi:hypothetical protein